MTCTHASHAFALRQACDPDRACAVTTSRHLKAKELSAGKSSDGVGRGGDVQARRHSLLIRRTPSLHSAVLSTSKNTALWDPYGKRKRRRKKREKKKEEGEQEDEVSKEDGLLMQTCSRSIIAQ